MKGTVDKTEKGVKLVATAISKLDALMATKGRKVEVSLRYPLSNGTTLQKLKSILISEHNGDYPLFLRIYRNNTDTLIATGIRISLDSEIIKRIEEVSGKGTVTFR